MSAKSTQGLSEWSCQTLGDQASARVVEQFVYSGVGVGNGDNGDIGDDSGAVRAVPRKRSAGPAAAQWCLLSLSRRRKQQFYPELAGDLSFERARADGTRAKDGFEWSKQQVS